MMNHLNGIKKASKFLTTYYGQLSHMKIYPGAKNFL